MGLMQDNEAHQDGLGGSFAVGGNVLIRRQRCTSAQRFRFQIVFLSITVGPVITLVVVGATTHPASTAIIIIMGAWTVLTILFVTDKITQG